MKIYVVMLFVFLGNMFNYAQGEEVCPEEEPCFEQPWYRACLQGFYAGALGGPSYFSNYSEHGRHLSFKPGYVVGGNFGYQFTSNRLEGEFTYRRNSFNASMEFLGFVNQANHIKNEIMTLMINGYSDFNFNFFIRPYIGYGVGYAKVCWKSDEIDLKMKSKNIAWQLMGGVVVDLNELTKLTLEYRYGQFGSSLNDQAVVFGFKYTL